jgi:hypothetical protein
MGLGINGQCTSKNSTKYVRMLMPLLLGSQMQSELASIASLVSVRDVFRPFVKVYEEKLSIADTFIDWMELACESSDSPLDQMALVVADGKPIGTITYDALESHKQSLSECIDLIEIDQIITIETSLMEASDMFARTNKYYFIIIDGNELVGWLSYHDLFKLPFRLALFAQFLSIESKMIIAAQGDSDFSFSRLSPARQERARGIYKKREQPKGRKQEPTSRSLITCTCLIDKFTMLKNNEQLFKNLPSLKSKNNYKKFEMVRNTLAHPNPDGLVHVLLARDQFGEFCRWVLCLNDELTRLLQGR